MHPTNLSLRQAASPGGIRRLLVVRLGAMGDVIHTLPAVSAWRQSFPETEIGWVIEERWSELLSSCANSTDPHGSSARPLIDHIHRVRTQAWRKSMLSPHTWHEIAGTVTDLRARRYEVAIDFQGAIRSALIAAICGANQIYGFAQTRETPASLLYTHRVEARGLHIIEQNLSLTSELARRELQLPSLQFSPDGHAGARSRRRLGDIPGYMLINPGAGWGAKRWPAERYGAVTRRIFEEMGLPSVINFGPGEENLARAVERESQGSAKSLSCSLAELIALTGRARLFIGGDTGPMHLAAALRIPVVAIFGPTNPARNGPFGTTSIVLRNPLSPTSHTRRKQADQGMLEIGVEDVVTAAMKLLKEARG